MLIGVALAPSAALADEEPWSRPVDAEGARLYDEGYRLFRDGDYDGAIARFRASYQRTLAPELLYDLGQAFRLKRDCAAALSLYRQFLAADPPGRRRAQTEARIADMERCTAAAAAPPAPPALPPASVQGAAVAPSSPAPASEPAHPHEPLDLRAQPPTIVAGTGAGIVAARDGPRPSARRRAGVGFAVATASLALAGGYFAWRASSASDQVSAAYVPGNRWSASGQQAERRGILSDELALAAGAGALLTAGVSAWLLWKR